MNVFNPFGRDWIHFHSSANWRSVDSISVDRGESQQKQMNEQQDLLSSVGSTTTSRWNAISRDYNSRDHYQQRYCQLITPSAESNARGSLTAEIIRQQDPLQQKHLFSNFSFKIGHRPTKQSNIYDPMNKGRWGTAVKTFRRLLLEEYKTPQFMVGQSGWWISQSTWVILVTDNGLVVSITNPIFKTPYELISGKVPQISHLKPFGCQVTILNTSDYLGKFEGKADDGYLVGNDYVKAKLKFEIKVFMRLRILLALDLLLRIAGVDSSFEDGYLLAVLLLICDPCVGILDVSFSPAGRCATYDESYPAVGGMSVHLFLLDFLPVYADETSHGCAMQERCNSASIKSIGSCTYNWWQICNWDKMDFDSTSGMQEASLYGIIERLVVRVSTSSGGQCLRLRKFEEEVYVIAKGFEESYFPKACIQKWVKALYGVHQDLEPGMQIVIFVTTLTEDCTIDKEHSSSKQISRDLILVQVEFENGCYGRDDFLLRSAGKQLPDGLFISQDKYVQDMLTKFDMESVRTATTPYEAAKTKLKDETDPPVNLVLVPESSYSMTSILECSQENLQVSNKGNNFRICGDVNFWERLISWQVQYKQILGLLLPTEAEYVAAASCCAQRHNMHCEDIHSIHQRTKHIEIASIYRDAPYEKNLIQGAEVHTDDIAMLVSAGCYYGSTRVISYCGTKWFLLVGCGSAGSYLLLLRLVLCGCTMVLLGSFLSCWTMVFAGCTMVLLGSYLSCWTIDVIVPAGILCSAVVSAIADSFCCTQSMVYCCCSIPIMMVEQCIAAERLCARLQYKDDHNRIAYLGRERGSEDFTDILSYLDHSPLRYALTHDPPVVFDSLVKQFWATATVRPNAAGSHDLVATLDGR
ncbi:hypothetical protein Tco_1320940 [Tanacetum coccineum]